LNYETDDHNYTVRIRVTDDLNTSFEKSFFVHLRNVIEDMDDDKIEDHYDDDIDGDGFSNEVEKENGTDPTDPYILPKLPILQTFEPREDENNTVFLSGRVLADGDAKIEDFGILLSRSIEYSSDDSSTHWIRGKGKPDAFGVSLNDFKFTGVIYYRSWAKNVAGYGVGPVKRIEIAELQERWWGKTRDLAGGWKQSEWFGMFIPDESGWLYHQEIGWLYSSAVKDGSVWLWNKPLGWVWTKQEAWPHLWSNRSKGWLYFFEGRSGKPASFYDYSSKSYR